MSYTHDTNNELACTAGHDQHISFITLANETLTESSEQVKNGPDTGGTRNVPLRIPI